METTIFCRMSGVDLADIAVGKIREKYPQIRAEVYSPLDPSDGKKSNGFFPFAALGIAANGTVMATPSAPALPLIPPAALDVSEEQAPPAEEPRAVTLKITCPHNLHDEIAAKLINLGALDVR